MDFSIQIITSIAFLSLLGVFIKNKLKKIEITSLPLNCKQMKNIDLTGPYRKEYFFSEEDEGWIGVIPELGNLSAFGVTLPEVSKELKIALEAYEESKKQQEKRSKTMNINDFAVKVSGLEKGKKEVNIAQIKEILKVVNQLLKGELYKLIRKL